MPETLDSQRLRSKISAQGISHSELARRSGLSRAQVHRLLSREHAAVRPQTLQRLAKAVGVEASELTSGGRLQVFRQWVASEQGFVDFRGIGMPRHERQPIDAVFVEPDVAANDVACEDECVVGGRNGVRRRPTTIPPKLASAAIRSQDRLVLLGDPGTGKTTLLRWTAHKHASMAGADAELPIYVRLPEFSRAQEMDSRTDLLKFVSAMAAARGCAEVEPCLRDELSDDKRRCLVLFDGLDEVGDEHRKEQLVASVREFIEQYPRNRFVITSRMVGFDPLPWRNLGFAEFRILGYGDRHLRDFVRKWAMILPPGDDRTEEDVLGSMQAAIFSNARVRALASNPLILTILVLLNESRGGALPRRRVDLYAKIVEVFLDTWESSKRATDTFDETFNIDLDAREFRWLLSDLSLAMQKSDRTLAPRWWIADRMRDYLQQKMGFGADEAKDASDRIIQYLAERTGLIEERGLGVFAFSHRTLQEYFASLGVMDEADASASRNLPECLRGYYYHPQWCEVVRLVAAQLTPPVAESLLTCIVDDPDPVGRFLKRGPLLALRCLSDGTTVPNRQLVTSVFNALADLGRSKWLGVTLEAFDVLETFEGTRMQQLAKDAVSSILQRAKEHLAPEDYGCLHERANFAAIFEEAESRLGPEFGSEAAREVNITIDGGSCRIVYFNGTLRLQNPAAWFRSVCSLLQDEGKDEQFKETLVREVGRHVVTDPGSRRTLRKTLESPGSATLRAACAQALGSGTRRRDDVKLLLRVLEHDADEHVRAACAAALKDAAARDSDRARASLPFL